MPWIKLDDQWMDHPKIIRAGRDARDMWLASITWCAKHSTDGFFPPELLPSLYIMAGIDVANCQTLASTLLEVCLWERTETAYHIHDYLNYQPTKEQTEINKKARSDAGRAGGVAKASKTPSKTLAKSWQKSAPSPSPSISTKVDKSSTNLVYPLALALSEVCKMDIEANKGRLLREAKTLTKASPTPTPALIELHYGMEGWWYREDWRGKNAESPSPATVRETWGKWILSQALEPSYTEEY